MYQFKVAKWGNSYALRIPSGMVRELGLKEGDLISPELFFNPAFLKAELEAARARTRMTPDQADDAIREARKRFPKHLKPEDWKIDRSSPDMRG